MIEMHDPILPEVGVDPFTDSIDYTNRMVLTQNMDIIKLLESLNVNMERLSNYMPQQLSKLRPTTIDMGPASGKPNAGTAAGANYVTTQKHRISYLFIGGAAGDRFRLTVGVQSYNFWNVTGAMIFLPFEIEIDRGVDIGVQDISTPGAINWTFMLQGYTE